MASIGSFGLDVGIYGPLARPEVILSLARHAEDTGFDSIWLADHVAFPARFKSEYPYSAKGDFPSRLDSPLLEPLATMGVLAGATKRVKLGTAVLVMPHRNPLLMARMLVTIDQLSGGRVILGAGVGWLKEEFEALKTYDFRKRGKVTDEYIQIFKAVCGGGEVGFNGETYSFAPVFSVPGSVQRPHPPVLIGGLADAALRRVARHGDGWLAVAAHPDMVVERLAVLKRMAEEEGRRSEGLSFVYKVFLDIGTAKRNKFGVREPGTGSVDEIVGDLARLQQLGFSRFVVRYRGNGEDELRRQIDRFVGEIVPRV